jgi:hypothetical protein
MTPALQRILFGAGHYPGAVVALDFLTSRYRVGGQSGYVSAFTGIPGLTVTRASTGYATTVSGSLVNFASGVARITDQGLLVEEARTNSALWARDFTNAAWTKANVTAAKDQVGADGVANSASSLVATAANGTAIQVITALSAAERASVYMKRLVGTGTVSISIDAVTYVDITSSLTTTGYTRVATGGTLVNPNVAIKIATSGDSVAVDFAQQEAGTFDTSPVATTTVAVTRPADDISIAGLSIAPLLTVLANFTPTVSQPNLARAVSFTDGSAVKFQVGIDTNNKGAVTGGGLTTTNFGPVLTAGQTMSVAANLTGGASRGSSNGAAVVAVTGTATVGTMTTMYLGDQSALDRALNGYLRRAVVYPTVMSDAQLLALSA